MIVHVKQEGLLQSHPQNPGLRDEDSGGNHSKYWKMARQLKEMFYDDSVPLPLPPSAPPPPPPPIGMGIASPPPLGTRRAISPIIRCGG